MVNYTVRLKNEKRIFIKIHVRVTVNEVKFHIFDSVAIFFYFTSKHVKFLNLRYERNNT